MSVINKKRIDALIPLAISVIKEGGFVKEGKVASSYHGYFSSFGADMVNSTPLAATIFYEESNQKDESNVTGSKENKSLIPDSIMALIKKERKDLTSLGNIKKLSAYLMDSNINRKEKINNIAAATAALKIALRSFPKS